MEDGIYDEAYQGDFCVRYPYEETIVRTRTAYQRVDILRTRAFGRALFLDHVLNSAEKDEFVYHEGIVHPAMARARNRGNVLIIGGAEGGTLREVLRYSSVERAVMVDIDQELVDICREHLGDIYGDPWSDERAEVFFEDGRSFLEQDDKYDVIIIDLNEASEEGPAQMLFTREFYLLARAALKPGGVVAVQSEWLHSDYHARLTATQKAVFPEVRPQELNIPSYLIAEAINLCCREPGGLEKEPEEIDLLLARELGEDGVAQLRYYNGSVDLKIGTLPSFIQEQYARRDDIFTDSFPPVYYSEKAEVYGAG